MKSIGFKEWALVCEALGSGRQSMILRKGGIAEGREGFAFRHREFFLFPTFFHGQIEKTRLGEANIPVPNELEITLRFFAKVEHAFRVESFATAAALAPFHVLQESVVRERFEDERFPGIHVAFVRVFRVEPEWILPNEKRYGGCRSWVELPSVPGGIQFHSVLTEARHREREKSFLATIGQTNTVTARVN
jgi:hypothetical protein